MRNRAEAFAVLVWFTLIGIMAFQAYSWSYKEIEKINFRFKTMEEMMNGNP